MSGAEIPGTDGPWARSLLWALLTCRLHRGPGGPSHTSGGRQPAGLGVTPISFLVLSRLRSGGRLQRQRLRQGLWGQDPRAVSPTPPPCVADTAE